MTDFDEQWNERRRGLEGLFGTSSEQVLHAVYPFQLGGQADVMVFPNHQEASSMSLRI
jgi:hypothetical protein